MPQDNYFQVTLVLKAKPGEDEDSLYDSLIEKTIAKNLIVEVTSVEPMDEYEPDDDVDIEDEDSYEDDDDK